MAAIQRVNNNHQLPQPKPVSGKKQARHGNKKVRPAQPNTPSSRKKAAVPKAKPVGLKERALVKQQNYRPANDARRSEDKSPVRIDENGVRYTNARAKPVRCNKVQTGKRLQQPGQYQDLQIIGQKIKLNPRPDQAEKKIAVKKAMNKAITTKPISLDEALNIVRGEVPKQKTRAKWGKPDPQPNYAQGNGKARKKWDKPDPKPNFAQEPEKARKKWDKPKQTPNLACDHKEESLPQQKESNKAKASKKQECRKALQSEMADRRHKHLEKVKQFAPNIYNKLTRGH